MIERYQLRYFLAVVDAGNFSRAAARINVTQPTLSIGIAKLEQQLGSRLFFRNSQRVHLTEAGGRFLKHARSIESEFNQVDQSLGGLEEKPLLRLGVLTTIPTAFLEDVVRRQHAAARPDRLEILEGGERELLARLDRGRIDLALTLARGASTKFGEEALFREGYRLAAPLDSRYAHVETVAAEDLADEVMVVRRHCEALSATSRYFTERGVRPEFSFRSTSDDRVLAMIRAGMGVTVMPASYRDPAICRPRLAGFDLQRTVGLIYADKASPLRTGGSAFVEAARAAATAHLAGAET